MKTGPHKYKSATVYFSSGTGNSYRTARWFAESCRDRGIPSLIAPVDQGDPQHEISLSEHLVALSFPTHGLMPPWSVLKFLFRMPRKRGIHFLCLTTRGSFFIGPLKIPGAAGLASFLPALILLFKGYSPRGAVSFDMPANMTFLHPALTPRHARRVVAAARKKADKYFPLFFRRKSLWLTKNNLYEFLWALPLLYFFPLFPLLYLIVGKFFMGKIMFANIHCKGCGVCVKSCPTGALVMRGGKKKRPYWRYNCEACLRCLNGCPNHAVEAGHSWAAILWTLGISLAAGSALYTWLTKFIPQLQSIRNWWTVELLDALFYYPVIITAYFLFFHLIRFKLPSQIFTYTSLERLFGQYREPDTSLQDLTRKTVLKPSPKPDKEALFHKPLQK